MTHTVHRFQASARPNSFNPETRTFTVVAVTGGRVDRGSYIEVFDIDSFFAAGLPQSLPLQTDHSTSVRNTIGRLTNFRLETLPDGTRAVVADAMLSSRADNEALAANIRDGVQTAFSIAFSVSKWRDGKDPVTGKKMRTAVAGRLVEGSLVVDPADPFSTIRNNTMPQANPSAGAEEAPEVNDVQLRSLAKAAGVAEPVIDAVLATDATTEQKMQTMLATLNAKPTVRTASNHNDETLDNPAVLRRAAVEAFDTMNRGEHPQGAAASVFADGEAAFARRLLRNAGENLTGLSDDMVKRNAAATSDYAIIAGATFNLSMRREYEAQSSPVSTLFGRSTVSGFNKETVGLVDWTTLEVGEKRENGHYRSSYIDESGEVIFVFTIGGVTAVSRELSINAGSRLGNMGQKYGKRLAADIADRQVTFLEQSALGGPKMADGKTVFHADRGNIENFPQSETSSFIAFIMKFRSDMAKRKGKGNVMIGEYPTYWLVHSDYEETAVRVLASVTASSIADVNPLAGKLQIVVEPRLSNVAKSWLAVEPAKMDGATRVFLRGYEAPFTDSRQNFDTDNIDFKIRQDFGLGWLEWRSWTRLDHT